MLQENKYIAHQNSQRATTQILGSYLKFEGQNLGYLSPTFVEANFGAKHLPPLPPPDHLMWKCPTCDLEHHRGYLEYRGGYLVPWGYHHSSWGYHQYRVCVCVCVCVCTRMRACVCVWGGGKVSTSILFHCHGKIS